MSDVFRKVYKTLSDDNTTLILDIKNQADDKPIVAYDLIISREHFGRIPERGDIFQIESIQVQTLYVKELDDNKFKLLVRKYGE